MSDTRRTSLLPAIAVTALLALVASDARAQETAEEPGMESPGMVAGGITMMALGAPTAGFGTFLLVFASNNEVNCVSAPCTQPDTTGSTVAGASMLIGGLGLIGGGIALVAIGAQDEEPASASARLVLTPSGAAVRGAF